jgi:hypothetical protein
MSDSPNRHSRRAAKARAHRNTQRHSSFYESYIKYLPLVPLDAPLEPGRVYHLALFHDEWCKFYETENIADCNCNPAMQRHIEPVRQ